MGERIGVVDAGGRGAAVAARYAEKRDVHVFPGNDGLKPFVNDRIISHPEVKSPANVEGIVNRCLELGIRYVDVCQDNALANGLSDRLRAKGITVVGPSQAAARIESSKVYARQLGARAGIPQPDYRVVSSMEDLRREAGRLPKDGRFFLKADGQTEGKGTKDAWYKDLIPTYKWLREGFEEATQEVLIEDFIGHKEGKRIEEVSYFVWADGRVFKRIGGAQDNKRIRNHDEGPNTGGMGCASPSYILTDSIMDQIDREFIDPILGALEEDRASYQGPLYASLAKEVEGKKEVTLPVDGEAVTLKLVEWNARWGDPEAEVLIPGIEQDLYEIGQATANHELDKINITYDGKHRVSVAGVSLGYPVDYNAVKGKRIRGLEEVKKKNNVRLYPAGITVVDSVPYASGGRLFHIVGEGNNPVEARERAYEAMAAISVDGNLLDFRTDIAWRDAQRYWMMQDLRTS